MYDELFSTEEHFGAEAILSKIDTHGVPSHPPLLALRASLNFL